MNKKITMEELIEDWHSRALEIDSNDRPTQQSSIYIGKLRELVEEGLKWDSRTKPVAYRNIDGETYYILAFRDDKE